MAGNNAFSLQGATPQQSTNSLGISGAANSSPYSKALNNYGSPQTTGTAAIGKSGTPASFNMNTAIYTAPTPETYSNQTPNLTSGLLSQSGSTPIKKQTVQTADGNTVTNEYHAPATDTSSQSQTSQSSAPQNNAGVSGQYTNPINQAQQSLSQQNDNYYNQFATNPSQYATGGVNLGASNTASQQAAMQGVNSQGINTQSSNYATNTPSSAFSGTSAQPTNNSSQYSGLINQLANEQNSPYNQAATGYIGNLANAATGNQALGQNAQNIANTAAQEIKDTGVYGANAGLGYLTGGGDQGFALGGSNAMANAASARQQAIAAGATEALQGNAQALTAQGQEQSGYNSAAGNSLTGQSQAQAATGAAAGYAAPVANTAYFGNPQTGGVYGQGNNLINNGISQAIQQYNAGGDPVALRAQILSQYGAPAAQAFDAQVIASKNGSYNPNAASAQVQQNTAFGQQTQGAAQNLNLAIASLKPVQSFATNFLTQSGINPTDAPTYNEQIDKYISTLGNPAAATQWAGIKNEIQTYANQILSAKQSANLPTTQDEQLAAQDPGSLSAKGLQSVFDTWDTLGGTNAGILSNASQQAYGGSTGYTGPNNGSYSSTIAPAAASTAPGSGLTSPLAQGAAGLGINAAQTAAGLPQIVSAVGGSLLTKLFPSI